MQLLTGKSIPLPCELAWRKSLLFEGVYLPVWVLCMTKQGHVHHSTHRWLWMQSPDAYGNMTAAGNVHRVSQCCSWARGEGVLERSLPRAEGPCWCWPHSRVCAVQSLPLSACETIKNTIRACSHTHGPMSGHVDDFRGSSEVQWCNFMNVRSKLNKPKRPTWRQIIRIVWNLDFGTWDCLNGE